MGLCCHCLDEIPESSLSAYDRVGHKLWGVQARHMQRVGLTRLLQRQAPGLLVQSGEDSILEPCGYSAMTSLLERQARLPGACCQEADEPPPLFCCVFLCVPLGIGLM